MQILQQVATLADQITGYSLASNYFDNFSASNSSASENIYTYGGGVSETKVVVETTYVLAGL